MAKKIGRARVRSKNRAKIERDVRQNQAGFSYPTMDERELRDFASVIGGMAASDCHLFLAPPLARLFARIKDDGRAEAALIALAGMRREGGTK